MRGTIRPSRRSVLALALTAPWVGCRRERLGERGSPLILALSPVHGSDGAAVRALEAELVRECALDIELRVAPNSEAAMRMAGSPNVDGGLLTLFEYLFAHQQHGVEAALRVLRGAGETHHRGEIVTLKESPLRSLADMKGKRIAYVEPASTTGFLLAAKALADAGVNVDHVFAGTHAAALKELEAGNVDAAATYAAPRAGTSLRTLAATGEIPNEPVFFRKGLQQDLVRRISDALVRISKTPTGRDLLPKLANITGFSPTQSSDYQTALAVVAATGKSVRDMVPRGWLLANENKRRPEDLAP